MLTVMMIMKMMMWMNSGKHLFSFLFSSSPSLPDPDVDSLLAKEDLLKLKMFKIIKMMMTLKMIMSLL